LVIGILVVKCVYGPFWCSPLRTFRHTQAQSHWNLCTNLIHQQVVPSWQLEIFYGLLLQKNMYVIAGISHRNGLLRNDSKERLTLELVPLCYVRHQSFGQDTLWLWAIPFNVPPPPMDEFFWWVTTSLGILWSLQFFWGVRWKFTNFWGGFLSALSYFLLRG
jgi:hypothetical protein